MNSLFLKALHCEEVSRPPVWMMRQAGRVLPSYRALRQKHSLNSLFHSPELASEVTLLPLKDLGVDALILFSDILVIAESLGISVTFEEGIGPVVSPNITNKEQVDSLVVKEAEEGLFYVKQTISLIKQQAKEPLIGFCGGPFTVATYLISKQKDDATYKAKKWIQEDSKTFELLLDKITQATISYLKMQIQAGVEAVQIFDSWANVLSKEEFSLYSLQYLKKIIASLNSLSIPVILFCRGSSFYPKELSSLSPQAISFDWHEKISVLREIVPCHIAVQGNFDPTILLSSPEQIRAVVLTELDAMRGKKGYIANLGHGVLPNTPFEHAKLFVDLIKEYQY